MKAFLSSLGAGILCIGLGTTLSPWSHPNLSDRQPNPFGSPGPEALAFISAEHRHGWSDVAWLDAVQRIGANEAASDIHHFERIAGLATISTDLDLRYWGVYDTAATYISAYSSKADLSDGLLMSGQKRLPKLWRFPFLMGWNDYFIRGLAQDAAQHWRKASLLPEAPFFLSSLSGRAMRQATGDTEASIEFLTSMLEHITDERQRKTTQERILILQSEQILEAYDHACKQFVLSEQGEPDSAAMLYLTGLVPYPPTDKLGSPITLDISEGDCIARTEAIKVRENEAVKRVGRYKNKAAMGTQSVPTAKVIEEAP